MNQKLKIFQMITTKILSISPRNLSERKEFAKMVKNSNSFIENGQKSDFYSKSITPSLPTLKESI